MIITSYQARAAEIGAVESPATAALNDCHESITDLHHYRRAVADRYQELGALVDAIEEAQRLIEAAGTVGPRLTAAITYAGVVTTEAYEALHDTEPRECYGPCMDIDPELPRSVREERADLAIVQIETAAALLEENGRPGIARAYNVIADALRAVVLDTTADAQALELWTGAAVSAIALLNRQERGLV